jgi:hypothetical protein
VGRSLIRRGIGKVLRGFPLPECLDDFRYTIFRYRDTFGAWPNLFAPRTFNEHLNHKKLFDRRPILTMLADKYAVRQYVRERVGEEYLNEVYLVTENPGDLDFSRFPDRFVVKATHGSGWNVIVVDKYRADERAIRKQCAIWLKMNYYDLGREWCYKHIPPRILVEAFIGDASGKVPLDFKFFCFDGIPRFIQVDFDRFEHHTRNLYDTSWNQVPCKLHYDNNEQGCPMPSNLDEMLAVAENLAYGLDFVRVDLYSVHNRVYFGEMTHYPGNGFERFDPAWYDAYFGSFWKTAGRLSGKR